MFKKNKKLRIVRKGCQNALKMVKIGCGGSKLQKLNFDSILLIGESLVDKKKLQFEKEKSKIRCLWTQLDFIEGLINFMESLIARKFDFGVNLGFNWKKLEF